MIDRPVRRGRAGRTTLQSTQYGGRRERPPQSYLQIYRLLMVTRWCEGCGMPAFADERQHPRKACPSCGGKVRPLHTRSGSVWTKARVERVGNRARAAQQQKLAHATNV